MMETYPRVPYICSKEYDGLPFYEYHLHCGFDVQRLYAGDFSQHLRHDTATFLQAWLFFGTLNEFFGDQTLFDPRLSVVKDEGGERICTITLNNHLATWAARIKDIRTKSEGEKHRLSFQRLGECLNTSLSICKSLSTSSDSPLPEEILFSFSILGCSIDHALQWY